MREEADPLLFKIKKDKGASKWSYNTSCPNQQMRQPYIVNKEEIETFNPKAVSGYMKYRNNYYICPRIWDYQARKPISVEELLKNNFKSPYTNGMILNPERRGKQLMNSQYNVIIRKPSNQTNSYWENEKLEKEWPKMLKGTGTDAYPGLISGKNHPQKLCYPCCFKAPPKDLDKSKVMKEVQNFKNPYGTYGKDLTCKVDTDDIKQKDISEVKDMRAHGDKNYKDEKEKSVECSNQNYIIGNNIKLENCRYGVLPDYLDVLLNNHQDIFLNSKKNALNPLSNVFLRKGVTFVKKGNFLSVIAMIKNVSVSIIKNIIFKSITPEIFITLNSGDLISIYSSSDLLPTSPKKHTKFIEFINNNIIISRQLNINVKDVENMKYDDPKILKDKKSLNRIKHIIIGYKIFTAYYNFMKALYDEDEIINYKHFLDLISRKNANLFPYGINVLIFNNHTKNLMCNPYLVKSNDIMILIKDGKHQFTPIYNVRVNSSGNIGGNYGSFRIHKFINLDSKTINYLKTKNININILEETKNRSVKIFNLLNIHNNYCTHLINVTNFVIIKKMLNTTYIKGQIITNTAKVQFLLLDTNYLLPIIPVNMILNIGVYFIDDIIKNTSKNIVKTWKYYENLNKELGDELNYKPSKLIIYEKGGKNGEENETDDGREEKYICGILFENKLIVPINNLVYNEKEIIDKLGDIPTENRILYYDEFVSFQYHENYLSSNITELLVKDYLYQQFKYDFSYYINEYNNRVYKKEILELIKKIRNVS